MSSRIDIELTSTRDDGSWTWRAAGAKQPKGVVEAAVLPGAPSVGDVFRVEVDTGLDGTEVTTVVPPKAPRSEPERLELASRDLSDDELVTSKLVGKKGRRDRDDDRRGGGRKGGRDGGPGGRERGRRPDRGRDGGPGGRGRDGRPGGDGRGGGDDRGARHDGREGGGRDRGHERSRRPRPDDTPKPKRLRARRAHRKAVLDTLEPHERPIAEEVLRGGIPAVRQAVEKQNTQARAEGRPEVDPAALEALAERLLPRLRTAEWRDRADAALADLDQLDLRDLRTVVVAADSAARDEESRALASQLKEGLERRIEADQAAWLAEMASLLSEGRVVRALRVSSRPPKAGVPLPADLASRLTEAASASLTADTPPDRWATVLDALSLSPVHAKVAPGSLPAEPSDELKAVAAASGEKVPLVAAALGVEPVKGKSRRSRGRSGPKGGAARTAPATGPRGKGPDTRPVPPPPPVAAPAPAAAAPVAAETAPAAAPSVVEASRGSSPPPVTEAPEAQGSPDPSTETSSAADPAMPVAEGPPGPDGPERAAPSTTEPDAGTAADPVVAEPSTEVPSPPSTEAATPTEPASEVSAEVDDPS